MPPGTGSLKPSVHILQVSAFQVAYRLLPGAAPWQPFGPLDPVALRMEAWKIQIAVSGDPVVPYGLQQENMLMLMLHHAKQKLQMRTVYFFRPAQVRALICRWYAKAGCL